MGLEDQLETKARPPDPSPEPRLGDFWKNPFYFVKERIVDPIDDYILRKAAGIGQYVESKGTDRHDLVSYAALPFVIAHQFSTLYDSTFSSLATPIHHQSTLQNYILTIPVLVNVMLWTTAAYGFPLCRLVNRTIRKYVPSPILNESFDQFVKRPLPCVIQKAARLVSVPFLMGISAYSLGVDVRDHNQSTFSYDFINHAGFLFTALASEAMIYLDSTNDTTLKQPQKKSLLDLLQEKFALLDPVVEKVISR